MAKGDKMERKIHAYDVKVVGRNADGEKVVAHEGRFSRVRDIRAWALRRYGEVEEVYPGFWRNGSTAIYYQMVY